jgi:hypothetical protein
MERTASRQMCDGMTASELSNQLWFDNSTHPFNTTSTKSAPSPNEGFSGSWVRLAAINTSDRFCFRLDDTSSSDMGSSMTRGNANW